MARPVLVCGDDIRMWNDMSNRGRRQCGVFSLGGSVVG